MQTIVHKPFTSIVHARRFGHDFLCNLLIVFLCSSQSCSDHSTIRSEQADPTAEEGHSGWAAKNAFSCAHAQASASPRYAPKAWHHPAWPISLRLVMWEASLWHCVFLAALNLKVQYTFFFFSAIMKHHELAMNEYSMLNIESNQILFIVHK